ncbi:MAG: hypothetical protein AAFN92_02185 [Bacteroidota bacterium]
MPASGVSQQWGKPQRMWLELADGTKIQGEYHHLTDEYLYYTPPGGASVTVDPLRVSLTEVADLRLRKKGAPGNRILLGTLIPAVIGGLIGLAQGDDPPGFLSFTAAEKMVGLGITGGLVGLVVTPTYAFAKKGYSFRGPRRNLSVKEQKEELKRLNRFTP